MLALANRRTQIDDLQWKLSAVMHSIFNFAPFILIQFDFTNAHVDNYNAIAAISRFAEKKTWSWGRWGVMSKRKAIVKR
jgi:hypothetical protein